MTANSGDIRSGSWYVKRGDQVRGPFGWDSICRDVGLGRLRATDRLSADQSEWQAVQELVPLPSGVFSEHPAYDERRDDRRGHKTCVEGAAGDLRARVERRAPESVEVQARRARSARVWDGLRRSPPQQRCALLVTGLVLSVIVAVAIGMSIPRAVNVIDCNLAAAPGVNWDFCNKSGLRLDEARLEGLSARSAQFSGASLAAARLYRANLAYADLSGVDLRLAELRGARMIGASLRHATLNHANLAGADLRYADLGGASVDGARFAGSRLDHAIWVDGRLCALNSVGSCRH